VMIYILCLYIQIYSISYIHINYAECVISRWIGEDEKIARCC